MSQVSNQVEALQKRVAELECELQRRAELYSSNETALRKTTEDLQWHIRNLQSQLAWTPVAKGLPTVGRETRTVLVVRDTHGGALLLEPRYHEDGEWKWRNPEFPFGIKFGDGCDWQFRRIELPEAP